MLQIHGSKSGNLVLLNNLLILNSVTIAVDIKVLDLLDDLCFIFEFRGSVSSRGSCRGFNNDIMVFSFLIFDSILTLVVLLRFVSDEKVIGSFYWLMAHLFESGERVLDLLAFHVLLRLIFYENELISGFGSYIRTLHHLFSSSY